MNPIKLFEAVKEAKGNDKVDVLKAHSYPMARNLLKMCYDPALQTYMKQVPKPKSYGTGSIDEMFPEFAKIFQGLTGRTLSGNDAKAAVLGLLGKCTPEVADCFTKVLKKDLKLGANIKTINTAFGKDFIYEFKVQLAESYDPTKTYKGVASWLASRKLNGLRGYFRPGDAMRSRKGHEFFGFQHVIDEVEALCKEYGFSFADGELYSHGIPFQTIQSYVRGDDHIPEEHKRKIRFNIFAAGLVSDDKASGRKMVDRLKAVDWAKYEYIVPVEYTEVLNSNAEIERVMRQYSSEGFEGTMLRNPNTPYAWKRSNDLLKRKPFYEADFRIVGFYEGDADKEFAGTLGGITIEGTVDWVVDGEVQQVDVRSNVGSGFSVCSYDKDGNKIPVDLAWNDGNWGSSEKPPRDWVWANQSRIQGLTVEIQYQGLSDKPQPDGTWCLQFGTFRALKMDR